MFDSLAFEPTRVDLAAHLLSDEAQLAARALLGGCDLPEIVAVIGEPDLLFGDVEFLDVEDHLLLQPVAVDVDLQLFEVFQQAGPDRLRAGLFERHDLLL